MADTVCIITLSAVYDTLTYIGVTASGIHAQDTTQTVLLSGVIRQIMETAGLACMGNAVAMACLVATVGIGAIVVSFVYEFLKKRVSYKLLMLITCIIRVFMGIAGVQNIVNYATLIFLVIHPVCIAMTILGLLDRLLPNDGFHKGGVLMTGIVGLGDAVFSVVPDIGWLKDLMGMFPLSDLGFARLVLTVIGVVVGTLSYRGKEKHQAMDDLTAEEAAKSE